VRLRFPRIPWRRITTGRALPWVLAVVFLGTTLTNWWLLRSDRQQDARAATVRSTATSFLTALTNFSATTIDQDVSRIKTYAVGDFATQADQTFSATRIAQIKRARVDSRATVRNVFVENVSGDQATVFGVIDESVTNSASASPRTDVLRVEVGMIETSGGWKANSVDILQTPGSTGISPSG